jgi:hypothetical protein
MKLPRGVKSKLLKGIEKECQYAEDMTGNFILSLELIAKLVYREYCATNKINGDIDESELEKLIDGLSIQYKYLTKGEIAFMAISVFHCFHGKIGIGPKHEQVKIPASETAKLAKFNITMGGYSSFKFESKQLLIDF